VFRRMLFLFLVSVAVASLADEAGKRVYSESFKRRYPGDGADDGREAHC